MANIQDCFVQRELPAPVTSEQTLYVFNMDPPPHLRRVTSMWNGTDSQHCLPLFRPPGTKFSYI